MTNFVKTGFATKDCKKLRRKFRLIFYGVEALKHDTSWPVFCFTNGGDAREHSSVCFGQRVRKLHPEGRLLGFGGSPSNQKFSVTLSPPMTGIAERSD